MAKIIGAWRTVKYWLLTAAEVVITWVRGQFKSDSFLANLVDDIQAFINYLRMVQPFTVAYENNAEVKETPKQQKQINKKNKKRK